MKKIMILVGGVILCLVGLVFYLANSREKPCASCEKNAQERNPREVASTTAPLPQEEDIIRNFFALINEKKPSEAVMMMSETITQDDPQKQAWAVQFNAIDSVKVTKLEPSMPEEWTPSKHTYQVTLEMKMNPDSEKAPIPYYGWENGENFRWITIVKEGALWRVQSIATGP